MPSVGIKKVLVTLTIHDTLHAIIKDIFKLLKSRKVFITIIREFIINTHKQNLILESMRPHREDENAI
jgi:hypothetical protein